MVLAHEKWFVDEVPPGDWSFAADWRTLALLAGAVAVTLAVRALARLRDGVTIPLLARLAPWMPFAVRIHLAVSLVGVVSTGAYLAPSLRLGGVSGWLLGSLAVAVAVLLVTGWRVRLAAVALLLAGPAGMVVYGVPALVERADVLGLALYLLLAGPGRWSADWELGRAADPGEAGAARGLWALRVATGASLIAVAFAEKLANPVLAQTFLDSQGVDLNVPAALGLPVGDLTFIRVAGAIEVLFGLLLVSGALPQAVVVVVGVPFNATLFLFGTIEMLGHLPIYAAMLVLLVYGSHPRLRPACSELWPWPRPASPGRRTIAAG